MSTGVEARCRARGVDGCCRAAISRGTRVSRPVEACRGWYHACQCRGVSSDRGVDGCRGCRGCRGWVSRVSRGTRVSPVSVRKLYWYWLRSKNNQTAPHTLPNDQRVVLQYQNTRSCARSAARARDASVSEHPGVARPLEYFGRRARAPAQNLQCTCCTCGSKWEQEGGVKGMNK